MVTYHLKYDVYISYVVSYYYRLNTYYILVSSYLTQLLAVIIKY